MHLLPPLIPALLIRRYNRFLADFQLEDGTTVTAHCPNSGSMKGCAIPGSPSFLSRSDNPGRKLQYTWELVMADGCWIGINTGLPNRLVRAAIEDGVIRELQGYETIVRKCATAATAASTCSSAGGRSAVTWN